MILRDMCDGVDVTIDTNVLVHSMNAGCRQHASSLRVLEWLRNADADTCWVMDNQGKAAPDPHTSVLYKEYREHLNGQSLPMVLFASFLKAGRVNWAERPDLDTRRKIRALVPRKTSDQAVLGAACGSLSCVLVSNDLDDFHMTMRRKAKARLGVSVITTEDALID